MYEWKNGSTVLGTDVTFEVTQPGIYDIIVTAGACSESDQITITSSLPEVQNVDLCEGETAFFTVTGGGTYRWCSDADCLTKVGEGSSFTTTPLMSTTKFYVKDTSSFETAPTGPSIASLSAERNYACSKTLIFDAEETFTIKTILTGAYLHGSSASGGISVDKDGVNYGTATVDFPAVSGSVQATMEVNIEIPEGDGYELTFTGAKINWFAGGMTLPVTYEDLITFTAFSQEGLPNSFPSLTNWVLSAGTNCDPAVAIASVGNCTAIKDQFNSHSLYNVFPNPSEGTFYINSNDQTIPTWTLHNSLGLQLQSSDNKTIDLQGQAPGLYLLRIGTEIIKIQKK